MTFPEKLGIWIYCLFIKEGRIVHRNKTEEHVNTKGYKDQMTIAINSQEYVRFTLIYLFSVNTDALTQDWLSHLRWILQKDNMSQDVFLIGKPGSLRRSLAMSYLELTQREVEYICLSRDTTEADIKQRREIVNGTAIYYDQVGTCSVAFFPF
jgi:AAA domain (dynein-related subfamily).